VFKLVEKDQFSYYVPPIFVTSDNRLV